MRRKEKKKLVKNIQTINDISSKKLSSKVKKRWKKNIKGALLGGGLGVLIAIAVNKSPWVFGVIGLIGGRMLFNKK